MEPQIVFFPFFKAPPHLRNRNEAAYEPKVISIGPYHRQKAASVGTFMQMEELKLWCLRMLIIWFNQRNQSRLDDYLSEMRALEPRARSFYSDLVGMADIEEFSEMLLVDGCFILRYLLHPSDIREYIISRFKDITWAWELIEYDLMLLENQIPFFVVEKLYELFRSAKEATNEAPPSPLDMLVRQFCNGFVTNELIGPSPPRNGGAYHLLGIFHSYVRPELPVAAPASGARAGLVDMSIPTATELHGVGIALRCDEEAGILDLSFSNGVLRMPWFNINDDSLPFLQNLVALEQCRPELGNHVTNYVCFMTDLLKNQADVELLRQKGVIVNSLGDDQEVASALANMNKNVYFSYEDTHMESLVVDLKKQYERRKRMWWRYQAELIHDYVGSPWKAISVAAAVILLVLTFIQAIYAVRSYKQSTSP